MQLYAFVVVLYLCLTIGLIVVIFFILVVISMIVLLVMMLITVMMTVIIIVMMMINRQFVTSTDVCPYIFIILFAQ